ncbi:hypothetical protein FRB96_004520 [Tulasnella sp. 330]|nr:hypothetical protein FRB96_004520 [Tulasnella sp. 330]
MPAAWKQALASAVTAGLIPNIVRSNAQGNYPAGTNSGSKTICNSAAQCREEGDVWDAPDGKLGVSFDDGPTESSPALYKFLNSQGQRATHFMIGINIKHNPGIFLQAFEHGDDIASHTWSHRFMSSLSNEDIVAELGWTQQIIADLSGGRMAKHWRPPFGDSDNRVRAIAKHVFGLTQVNWNKDTDDWEIPTGQTSLAQVTKKLNQWINGPKSPGLIILEHELSSQSVNAFIAAYPAMKAKGWDTRSIPDLFGQPYYLNAWDNSGAVAALNLIPAGNATVSLTPSSAAITTSAAAPSSSAARFSSTSVSAAVATNTATSSHKNSAMSSSLPLGLGSLACPIAFVITHVLL